MAGFAEMFLEGLQVPQNPLWDEDHAEERKHALSLASHADYWRAALADHGLNDPEPEQQPLLTVSQPSVQRPEKDSSGLAATLPDDILQEIFLRTLPPDSDLRNHNTSSDPCSADVLTTRQHKTYTPWAIRQVCGRWRSAVLSMFSLWRNVTIVIRSNGPRFINFHPALLDRTNDPRVDWPAERHIKVFKALLPVEGQVGLRLWSSTRGISAYRNTRLDDPEIDATLMRSLIPAYGDRMTSLTLRVSPECGSVLLTLQPTFLKNLETFHLEFAAHFRVSFGPDVGASYPTSRPLSQAKVLETLTFRGLPHSSIPSFLEHCCVPWSQIRDLFLHCPDPSVYHEIIDILRQCTLLTHLQIALWNISPPWMAQRIAEANCRKTVTLRRLNSLTLDSDMPLLHHITAPSLRSFTIARECHHIRSHTTTFLQRSSPTLENFDDQGNLSTRECPTANDDLLYPRELSEHLPYVRHLRLGQRLDALALSEIVQGKLFPTLETLCCSLAQPARPLQIALIVQQACLESVGGSNEPAERHRRKFRAFTRIPFRLSRDDISTFQAHAEDLLRSTGIELECIPAPQLR